MACPFIETDSTSMEITISLLSGLIGAVIGGLITIIGQLYLNRDSRIKEMIISYQSCLHDLAYNVDAKKESSEELDNRIVTERIAFSKIEHFINPTLKAKIIEFKKHFESIQRNQREIKLYKDMVGSMSSYEKVFFSLGFKDANGNDIPNSYNENQKKIEKAYCEWNETVDKIQQNRDVLFKELAGEIRLSLWEKVKSYSKKWDEKYG